MKGSTPVFALVLHARVASAIREGNETEWDVYNSLIRSGLPCTFDDVFAEWAGVVL